MYRDYVSMNVTQTDDPPLTGNFTGGLHRTSNQILTLLESMGAPSLPWAALQPKLPHTPVPSSLCLAC